MKKKTVNTHNVKVMVDDGKCSSVTENGGS